MKPIDGQSYENLKSLNIGNDIGRRKRCTPTYSSDPHNVQRTHPEDKQREPSQTPAPIDHPLDSTILRMPSLPQYQERRGSSSKTFRGRGIFTYLAAFLALSWAARVLYGLLVPSHLALPSDTDLRNNSEAADEGQDKYGLNARPGFTDMVQLIDLPSNFLPETGKHRHLGRLVIVGDVHGMKESLVNLLDKVKFDEKQDHLILAGDMISKGPDSAGVIDMAMKLGATGVRGNHEDRTILAYDDMMADHISLDAPGPSEERDKSQDALEEVSFNHGDYKDRALVRALGKRRMKWLKQCPVILRVGKLGSLGEVVVVHAGLAAGVALKKQDPFMVMNMRTIKDGVPSEERDGIEWISVWNKFQKKLHKSERSTVIYGHDSKRGLRVEDYSIGIDTGCMKGGRLTAVVIEGGNSDHKSKIIQVDCKDVRSR